MCPTYPTYPLSLIPCPQPMPRILISILLIFLPFHAFLVTLASKYILGGNKDNLPILSFVIASWKEIIIFILFIFGIKNIQKIWKNYTLVSPTKFQKIFKKLNFWMLIFVIIHLVFAGIQILILKHSILQTFWGIRTNLEMIGLFWIIQLFSFDKKTILYFLKLILISTLLSLTLGIAQLSMPCESLEILGYTPYKSSWVGTKPLPCGHGVGNNLSHIRMMGTFSGPNQLASFLLIIFGILIYFWKEKIWNKKYIIGLSVIFLISLFFTYARGAILGGMIAGILLLSQHHKQFFKKNISLVLILSILATTGIITAGLTRIDSTKAHLQKPIASIERIIENPIGVGVGQSGPVSLRFWGEEKAKISENWYLQITEEIGLLGGIVLIMMLIYLYFFIEYSNSNIKQPLLFIYTALLINNIFLHTFASDSITTITLFLLLSLSSQHPLQNPHKTLK